MARADCEVRVGSIVRASRVLIRRRTWPAVWESIVSIQSFGDQPSLGK